MQILPPHPVPLSLEERGRTKTGEVKILMKKKDNSCMHLLNCRTIRTVTMSNLFIIVSPMFCIIRGTKETFNISLNEQIKLIMDPEYQWHRPDKGVFSLAPEHPTWATSTLCWAVGSMQWPYLIYHAFPITWVFLSRDEKIHSLF